MTKLSVTLKGAKMTRGLSKQQRQILGMLKTKQIPNSDIGYFSTQEIVIELNPQYTIWLIEVKNKPFTSNRKHHIDYPKYDKIRLSIYRALTSLEKRGLIVSFLSQQSRFWAIPERLKNRVFGNTTFNEMDWVEEDKKRRKARRISWKWGAFIRKLPLMLKVKYKIGVLKPEEIEEIRKLAEKEGFSKVATTD